MCVYAHEKEKTENEKGRWEETEQREGAPSMGTCLIRAARASSTPIESLCSLVTEANIFPVCLNWSSNTCNKGISTRRQFAIVSSPKPTHPDDAKMLCITLPPHTSSYLGYQRKTVSLSFQYYIELCCIKQK